MVPQTQVQASEAPAQLIQLKEGATVEELVRGLQTLGATARDIVSILQAIKAAGALEADLEVFDDLPMDLPPVVTLSSATQQTVTRSNQIRNWFRCRPAKAQKGRRRIRVHSARVDVEKHEAELWHGRIRTLDPIQLTARWMIGVLRSCPGRWAKPGFGAREADSGTLGARKARQRAKNRHKVVRNGQAISNAGLMFSHARPIESYRGVSTLKPPVRRGRSGDENRSEFPRSGNAASAERREHRGQAIFFHDQVRQRGDV